MHHMVAAEGAADLSGVQQIEDRRLRGLRLQLAASVRGAVRRRQQQGRLPGTKHGEGFLEPHHRQAGAAREPQQLDAAAHQDHLDLIDQAVGHRHRTLGGAGELALGDRLLQRLAPGRDPHAATGQPPGHVRRHLAVRVHHEAQQRLLGVDRTGHQTTPLRSGQPLGGRPGPVPFGFCCGVGSHHHSAALSATRPPPAARRPRPPPRRRRPALPLPARRRTNGRGPP